MRPGREHPGFPGIAKEDGPEFAIASMRPGREHPGFRAAAKAILDADTLQ